MYTKKAFIHLATYLVMKLPGAGADAFGVGADPSERVTWFLHNTIIRTYQEVAIVVCFLFSVLEGF